MSNAPPPLKKRKRPEPEHGFSLGPPALDLSGIEDAGVGEEAAEADPKEGEWLFMQDEVVLGPVSAAVLIQRIEQGELEPDSRVGREAGKWRPLKSVPYFKEILTRAESRRQAIQEQHDREARLKQQGLIRMSTVAAIALMPILLGAVAGRTVMIERPWDTADEWLQQPPPLVDLPPQPKKPPAALDRKLDKKKDEPKDENAGDDSSSDDAKAGDADDKKDTTKRRRTKKPRGKKDDGKKPVVKKDKPAPSDDGKVFATLTQKQVMKGLGKAQSSIGRCLKTEIARNPSMPSRVTLMFTITETGKATNFKVKERSLRKGPLATCLNKSIMKLRWPKFTGERKNVELPLSVNKK